FVRDGLRVTYTYCAAPDERGVMVRVRVTNERDKPAPVRMGMQMQWAALNRVTYEPVAMEGEKTASKFSPDADQAWFSFGGADNDVFAWAVQHPGSKAVHVAPTEEGAVARGAARDETIAPGASAEAVFLLGIGVDRVSAQSAAVTLDQKIRRSGSDGLVR